MSTTHPETETLSTDALPANYRWWQENGSIWVERYDAIKKKSPKYHIAEFILCEYIAQHAPARVLEFGCGTGRHLRNLRTLPGIQPYGYDQSPTMVVGMEPWAEPEWLAEHVRLGPPLAKLPYDDNSFDIVYTASVLIHVRPEDLLGILSEIMRVSRGHILHHENRVGWTADYAPDHDGCWTHNLPEAYRALGWECEDLSDSPETPAVFRALAPGVEPKYTPSATLLSLYEKMVRALMGPR